MIASTHNRTQDLGHPRGNEGGSRYITSAVCGQWLLIPTASCAVYVWSESWACPGHEKSTVEATAWLPLLCKSESLATRRLPVPWRACMGDRVPLPSLSTVMGLFCLSSVVVSQVIHPSAETWEQCFSALHYPGWCTVAAMEVQLHLPALATVTALSAQTITLRLFLLWCIIMGKFKKEM